METVAGTASTMILGALEEHFDAKNNKELYGKILCDFVVFAYAGSIPFFILAGIEYKKAMLEKKRKEED